METISVGVFGALGKMGSEVISAVSKDSSLILSGAVDIKARAQFVTINSDIKVPLYTDLNSLIQKNKPQVLVDFSIAEASLEAIRTAAKHNIHIVSGTTGFTEANREEFKRLAKDHNIGIIISSNFALGAVVLMHLCKLAANYFDNVEIIEMHHDTKVDSPSGTALTTAKAMLEARKGKPFKYTQTKKENLSGCRGGEFEGIAIHSIRLPGFSASQEVIFGHQGQTLKIRHDVINRECYMPGVLLSIKQVMQNQGKVLSLEDLLKIGG